MAAGEKRDHQPFQQGPLADNQLFHAFDQLDQTRLRRGDRLERRPGRIRQMFGKVDGRVGILKSRFGKVEGSLGLVAGHQIEFPGRP